MNKSLRTYPGARWWKFDFHTHTPASRDSYWSRSNANLSPEEWLLRYMAAEVDCLAVTDHNSGDWIDRLKDTYARMKEKADAGSPPEGFRELTIFPGVEISTNGGVHILAIFDPSASTATVASLLGAVGFPPSLHGFTDSTEGAAVTRASIAEVLEAITETGGIAIPAHADDEKGLLQCSSDGRSPARDANSVRQALEDEDLIAMEWLDLSNRFPEYVAKEEPRFAKVLGSDSHSFQGNNIPGSAFTWVKMARPTLEGLRLALLDGNDVSIRRSDEGGIEPFRLPDHRIRAIEIDKARYMGNGHPARIECSPYFNAIVGGRGTGKSTIVHALRLALARGEELKSLGENTEPTQRFDNFRKVPKGRDGIGALRDDTEIRVEWEHEDRHYRLVWKEPGVVTVQEADEQGNWCVTDSQQNIATRFPVRIFSQGQIAEMAGSGRHALLMLIDEAAEVEKFKRAFEEAKRAFLTYRARQRELEGRLAQRPEVERRLNEVSRKLQAFERADYSEVLAAHAMAERQRKEVDELLQHINELSVRITEVAQDTTLYEWPDDVFDESMDSDMIKWWSKADSIVQEARNLLEDTSSRLARSVRELEEDPLYLTWTERVQTSIENFKSLQRDLEAEGVTDTQTFDDLLKECRELEGEKKRLHEVEKQLEALMDEIREQWNRVVEARRNITSERAKFVQNALQDNRHVRIKIVPFGFDPRAIELSLRELLEIGDERFENDVLAVDSFGNPTGGLVLDVVQQGDRLASLEEVKRKLQTIADELGGHFKNYLKKKLERPDFADHIQCWFPEDDLHIEYSRGADGTDWMPITQGSQGQRSAALLAFLLAFGDEPLILDQPEDDLDNHLIYDLIVRQIRENKLRRQLIVVTHNPNVVVNGDAELVHVMEYGRGQCIVKGSGALQEMDVREEVCRVMEGGRDAFELRWKRLGKRLWSVSDAEERRTDSRVDADSVVGADSLA